MQSLHAVSYSTTLPLPRLAGRTDWSILSHHHHACNLLADDGTLVALVSEAHGNGPFHIVVPGARFDTITTASPVAWSDLQIHIGHCTIDLRTTHLWHPRLAEVTALEPTDFLLAHLSPLQSASPLYTGLPALVARAQRGMHRLQSGLIQHNEQFIAEGTKQLAGLGPGLTPAGDDFLVGLLAALTAWPARWPATAAIRQQIATCARPHTTRLSGTWLAQAGVGHFGEAWHQLVATLNAGVSTTTVETLTAMAMTGATSGIDALCGFHFGLQFVAR